MFSHHVFQLCQSMVYNFYWIYVIFIWNWPWSYTLWLDFNTVVTVVYVKFTCELVFVILPVSFIHVHVTTFIYVKLACELVFWLKIIYLKYIFSHHVFQLCQSMVYNFYWIYVIFIWNWPWSYTLWLDFNTVQYCCLCEIYLWTCICELACVFCTCSCYYFYICEICLWTCNF